MVLDMADAETWTTEKLMVFNEERERFENSLTVLLKELPVVQWLVRKWLEFNFKDLDLEKLELCRMQISVNWKHHSAAYEILRAMYEEIKSNTEVDLNSDANLKGCIGFFKTRLVYPSELERQVDIALGLLDIAISLMRERLEKREKQKHPGVK